jgi:hypothetical protein
MTAADEWEDAEDRAEGKAHGGQGENGNKAPQAVTQKVTACGTDRKRSDQLQSRCVDGCGAFTFVSRSR